LLFILVVPFSFAVTAIAHNAEQISAWGQVARNIHTCGSTGVPFRRATSAIITGYTSCMTKQGGRFYVGQDGLSMHQLVAITTLNDPPSHTLSCEPFSDVAPWKVGPTRRTSRRLTWNREVVENRQLDGVEKVETDRVSLGFPFTES
jgi:hypothetical protein